MEYAYEGDIGSSLNLSDEEFHEMCRTMANDPTVMNDSGFIDQDNAELTLTDPAMHLDTDLVAFMDGVEREISVVSSTLSLPPALTHASTSGRSTRGRSTREKNTAVSGSESRSSRKSSSASSKKSSSASKNLRPRVTRNVNAAHSSLRRGTSQVATPNTLTSSISLTSAASNMICIPNDSGSSSMIPQQSIQRDIVAPGPSPNREENPPPPPRVELTEQQRESEQGHILLRSNVQHSLVSGRETSTTHTTAAISISNQVGTDLTREDQPAPTVFDLITPAPNILSVQPAIQSTPPLSYQTQVDKIVRAALNSCSAYGVRNPNGSTLSDDPIVRETLRDALWLMRNNLESQRSSVHPPIAYQSVAFPFSQQVSSMIGAQQLAVSNKDASGFFSAPTLAQDTHLDESPQFSIRIDTTHPSDPIRPHLEAIIGNDPNQISYSQQNNWHLFINCTSQEAHETTMATLIQALGKTNSMAPNLSFQENVKTNYAIKSAKFDAHFISDWYLPNGRLNQPVVCSSIRQLNDQIFLHPSDIKYVIIHNTDNHRYPSEANKRLIRIAISREAFARFARGGSTWICLVKTEHKVLYQVMRIEPILVVCEICCQISHPTYACPNNGTPHCLFCAQPHLGITCSKQKPHSCFNCIRFSQALQTGRIVKPNWLKNSITTDHHARAAVCSYLKWCKDGARLWIRQVIQTTGLLPPPPYQGLYDWLTKTYERTNSSCPI